MTGAPVPNARAVRTHILTIALEDYFHAPAFRGLIDQKHWGRFESRCEASCLSAFELLERQGCSATFFASPWIAEKYPQILQEVLLRGHEVALSGDRGPSFRALSRETFRESLKRSKAVLENACGRQVLGYRRSDVFLRPDDLWGLEILAEEGFLYDSSLSPALWAFRREPWRQFVHKVETGSASIWEFPLSSQRLGNFMLPFAGGNYFRQFPQALIDWSIRQWNASQTQPLVLYFRVWDLDPTHPRIQTGSVLRDLQHYRNSERIIPTLKGLFQHYHFDSIANYLDATQEALAPRQDEASADPVETYAGEPAPLDRKRVSVVIPCYNEEASIPYLSASLHELATELRKFYELQFILVDDGSVDGTWTQLERVFGSRSDSALIRHPENRGVAAAIDSGIRQSHEIACSLDCDCSYDPHELKSMLELLTPGVDLVTASPYHPQGRVANVPSWRLGLSRGASMLYRLATGSQLYTFTSCLRVYRRSAVVSTQLQRSGFLGIAELACHFALQGRKIVEYPATLNSRRFGHSKMKVARTILGHLQLMTRFGWARLTRQDPGLRYPTLQPETGEKVAVSTPQSRD